MSSDRNVKLQKCQHIFKQGQKAGKKCNRNCRDEYCKDHNKNRHNYEKKRYDKKVSEKKINEDVMLYRIRNAKCKTDLPDSFSVYNRHLRNTCKAITLIDKINALKIMRGDMTLREFSDKCTDIRRLRCVERYMDNFKKKNRKNIKMNTHDDIQNRFDRLLRKRDKLLVELKLSKKILGEYTTKEKQLEIEEDIIYI